MNFIINLSKIKMNNDTSAPKKFPGRAKSLATHTAQVARNPPRPLQMTGPRQIVAKDKPKF